jgi:RND superfamily putative drug exporter
MVLGTEGKETFPASVPAVATYQRLTALFPEAGISHLVVVRTGPARAGEVTAALDVLAARTAGDPAFAPGARIGAAADGTTSTFQVPVPHPENSAEARASLDRLPALLRTTLPDVEYAVSGEVARGSDYAAHQAQRLPWVVARGWSSRSRSRRCSSWATRSARRSSRSWAS